MKKGIKGIALGGAVVLAVAGLLLWGNILSGGDQNVAEGKVTVWKSPTCGCCDNYVDYLERSGFEVEEVDVIDLAPVKREYGIPPHLESCHTSVVDGYVVEGHIPVGAISKLLEERPAISGIALPGMPSGSPGMPGVKYGPFEMRVIAPGGGDGGTFLTL